jgi:hypothetical protein
MTTVDDTDADDLGVGSLTVPERPPRLDRLIVVRERIGRTELEGDVAMSSGTPIASMTPVALCPATELWGQIKALPGSSGPDRLTLLVCRWYRFT